MTIHVCMESYKIIKIFRWLIIMCSQCLHLLLFGIFLWHDSSEQVIRSWWFTPRLRVFSERSIVAAFCRTGTIHGLVSIDIPNELIMWTKWHGVLVRHIWTGTRSSFENTVIAQQTFGAVYTIRPVSIIYFLSARKHPIAWAGGLAKTGQSTSGSFVLRLPERLVFHNVYKLHSIVSSRSIPIHQLY